MKRFTVSLIAAVLALAMLAGFAEAARWRQYGVARTAGGAVISGATVQIYLAGGTTPADVYESESGGVAVQYVLTDSAGRFEYYVDAADYSPATRFKEVITKGSTSTTRDNLAIVRWDPTVNQSLAGELTITGLGNGITFPDGTRQTTNAAPGSGVSNTGDVSIAADTDANGSGEITLSTQGVARARVPNAGGLEINDSGTWRQMATQDGSETLSNKTLTTPTIGDFSNAGHDHSNAANGGALSSPTITGTIGGSATITSPTITDPSITGWTGAKGYSQGLAPRYKDADELYIGSGVIEIDGKICELSTETAFDCDAALGGAFSSNTWYFMGFSSPASGTALTSTEFVVTITTPTWSESKMGWYTVGGARIINRFRTNGSSQIDNESEWINRRYYHSSITILSDTTPAYGSPELISANVPAWGVKVLCGGTALVNHLSVSNALVLCSGSGRQRGTVRVLEAASYNDICWEAETNTSGQIGHYGNNTTYTAYEIKKAFDELPPGI